MEVLAQVRGNPPLRAVDIEAAPLASAANNGAHPVYYMMITILSSLHKDAGAGAPCVMRRRAEKVMFHSLAGPVNAWLPSIESSGTDSQDPPLPYIVLVLGLQLRTLISRRRRSHRSVGNRTAIRSGGRGRTAAAAMLASPGKGLCRLRRQRPAERARGHMIRSKVPRRDKKSKEAKG